MPKVSVIVPVYNTAKYLSLCLDSLLAQSLKDLEVICINDASVDNSLQILEAYARKDKRLKIIDFKENVGVSKARNAGLEAALGEYVGFADSDDTIDADFYEKLYTKAKETNTDIAKADLKEIFPSGKVKVYNQNENILKFKNKACFILSFTSAIYRLELIRKEKCFFNHRLTHTEDLLWLNRLVLKADKVEIVPDTYYLYQRRTDSTDTPILSERNAQSAYVAYKHIFLNTFEYAKTSDLDFSICYQYYFGAVLSFIFRAPSQKYRMLCCKLLLFFYQTNIEFYKKYLLANYWSFYPCFESDDPEKIMEFLQDKHSFADLICANLRYNINKNKKNDSPKISVIIPVYNVQDYLGKCLDSICNQTYKNLEIICVDDCSCDNSLNILHQYSTKDSRFKIVRRSTNGGQAAARQSGIDAASGEYIGFVDSDDWIDNTYYEKMLETMQKDHTDIVVNNNIILDYEDGKSAAYLFPGHKTLEKTVYTNPHQLIDKFYCVVWNKLYKADFLKKRQYTIPLRSAHEDVFFHYATFAYAKNLSFFDGAAYHYLSRSQSISKMSHDWGVEHIKVYSQIFDFYKKNGLFGKKIKLYSTMPFMIVKSEEMFREYKKYFDKLMTYINEYPDIFNNADTFICRCIAECKDYAEYKAKYPANLMMIFLRSKK